MTAPELPSTRGFTPSTDPGGVAAGGWSAVSILLVALGVSNVVAAKWLLVAQALVGLGSILWARARAWPPAKVWLEAMAARAAGEHAMAITQPRPRRR